MHGIALGIVLGAVTFQVVHGFSAHYTHTLVVDLSEEGPEYAHAAASRPAGESMGAFSRSYLQSRALPSGHVLVIGLSGQPTLASTGGRAVASSASVTAWLLHPPAASALTTSNVAGASYLLLASPIRDTAGTTVGVLVAGANLAHLTSQRDQVLLLAGLEAAIALAVALLSSYLVLRRMLRTVGAVTQAAVEASVADLGVRFGAEATDDEVGRLCRAFDGMLERIGAGLDAQRQLLSDVSHQLRTPLTVARGHLEVLERNPDPPRAEVTETTERVIAELSGMAELVDRLLLLGRSFSPDFLETSPVALRAFMGELFGSAHVLADRHWVLGEVPDVVVDVDGPKLRGALLNLVDNAVKATTPGDTIELHARYESELIFRVADTGVGIDDAVLDEVFDRFRRSGPADRRGAGLGLAIVKAVAEAHGGWAHLQSVEGRGTTAEIGLPPARVRLHHEDDEESEPAP